MEELRNQVWDHLFRADQPLTMQEIATLTDLDDETLRKVVDHPWFEVANDSVTIAYTYH